MLHGEFSCRDGSKYVWQRGVYSLQGQVIAAQSWPLFGEKKITLCYEKPPDRNFDLRAKSSWEDVRNRYKKILSGGFCSKVKIAAWRLFVTPYFCWQLAFYWHLPTSGRQNMVKTAPQPLFVNRVFVALYVKIISPVGPIPISLFVFEVEAKE